MRFPVLSVLLLALVVDGLPIRGGRSPQSKAGMSSKSKGSMVMSSSGNSNEDISNDYPTLVKPPGMCSADEPCGRCEGHCRRDGDCRGNLICFFKDEGVAGQDSVPGCQGTSPSTTDWCTIGQRNDNDPLPLLTPVRTCTVGEPCGRCEGHCSGDDVCEGDLVCFLKDEGVPGENSVPGCTGTSLSKTDWCTTTAAIAGTF